MRSLPVTKVISCNSLIILPIFRDLEPLLLTLKKNLELYCLLLFLSNQNCFWNFDEKKLVLSIQFRFISNYLFLVGTKFSPKDLSFLPRASKIAKKLNFKFFEDSKFYYWPLNKGCKRFISSRYNSIR